MAHFLLNVYCNELTTYEFCYLINANKSHRSINLFCQSLEIYHHKSVLLSERFKLGVHVG